MSTNARFTVVGSGSQTAGGGKTLMAFDVPKEPAGPTAIARRLIPETPSMRKVPSLTPPFSVPGPGVDIGADGIGNGKQHPVPMPVFAPEGHSARADRKFSAQYAFAEGDGFPAPIRIVEAGISKDLQQNVHNRHRPKL